jgi:pyrimidine operon attenuation protein/uracil phosphoribosyltransferase
MSDQHAFRIADQARVEEMLDALARRIHAALGDGIKVLGIRRRGVPLAGELTRRLGALAGTAVDTGEVTLKRYDDDLTILHEHPELRDEDVPFDLDGATVLLVDDVLYTGRTTLRAVSYAVAEGVAHVHVAVLCSRGPNDVPVHADFVGMQLDVGPGNIIEVHAPPYEDAWGVVIQHQPDDD